MQLFPKKTIMISCKGYKMPRKFLDRKNRLIFYNNNFITKQQKLLSLHGETQRMQIYIHI